MLCKTEKDSSLFLIDCIKFQLWLDLRSKSTFHSPFSLFKRPKLFIWLFLLKISVNYISGTNRQIFSTKLTTILPGRFFGCINNYEDIVEIDLVFFTLNVFTAIYFILKDFNDIFPETSLVIQFLKLQVSVRKLALKNFKNS